MAFEVGTNSYVSVADADAYHADRETTAWTSISGDAGKEAALIRATQYIDGRYAGRWPGSPADGRDQTLAWPRADAYDNDGELIDYAAIPREIVAATCEAAALEVATPGTLAPLLERGGKLKSLAVAVSGAVSRTQTWADGAPVRSTVTKIDDLLRGIVRSSRLRLLQRG